MSMKLPKLESPKFTTILPKSKKEVTYRPYSVKEEKILFIAIQSADNEKDTAIIEKTILDAVLQILENCVDVVVSELTMTDIEWLFLKLRSVSVSPELNIGYRINDCDDTECPGDLKIKVHLDNAYVETQETSFEDIGFIRKKDYWLLELNGGVGIALKQKFIASANDEEILFQCTEYIYDKDNVYTDFSKDDFIEFLEYISMADAEKIKKLFINQEKIVCDIKGKCGKCDKEFKNKLRGLHDFFM